MLSSWINQDPLLVFRMAAVPEGGRDEAMKEGCLQEPWNHKLCNSRQLQFIQMWLQLSVGVLRTLSSPASGINPFMLNDVAQRRLNAGRVPRSPNKTFPHFHSRNNKRSKLTNSLTFERCEATNHVGPLRQFNPGPAYVPSLSAIGILLSFPSCIPLLTARRARSRRPVYLLHATVHLIYDREEGHSIHLPL